MLFEDRTISRLCRLHLAQRDPMASTGAKGKDNSHYDMLEIQEDHLVEIGNGLRGGITRKYLVFTLWITLGLVLWLAHTVLNDGSYDAAMDICPQTASISPSTHSTLMEKLEQQYLTDAFRSKVYESLGGAVRIPTMSYDDLLPPGQDPRWAIFSEFHTYLENRFPLLHRTLNKTTVNTYALVYHWQGTAEPLKPVLLAAHQDVVPIEPTTLRQWQHPPFSGHFDGEWIWGRGSCDDKSGLIGILTAVESLLEQDFVPSRTVVLAFGIDEERGGISGATAIATYLESIYGKDGFALLVDEGGGYSVSNDTIIVSPSVAEKGSFNVRMEVSTPGGHSSVPPSHTSIGILAALIKELEANPHETRLHRNGTTYEALQCSAAHDPTISESLRKLITHARRSDKALRKLETALLALDPKYKAILGTTQAVDIIHGGVKTNALPERAYTIINHRIATHSSVAAFKARFSSIIIPAARKFNLSVDAFGNDDVGGVAHGKLVLSDAFGTALEPAPITETTGSGPYKLLSGTIIGSLNTSSRYSGKKVVVSPGMMLGNTDTKHYWNLTKHIFRYGHVDDADSFNGAHTVNEAKRGEGLIEMTRWFSRFILNADETNLLD